jgi:hypothetical protein
VAERDKAGEALAARGVGELRDDSDADTEPAAEAVAEKTGVALLELVFDGATVATADAVSRRPVALATTLTVREPEADLDAHADRDALGVAELMVPTGELLELVHSLREGDALPVVLGVAGVVTECVAVATELGVSAAGVGDTRTTVGESELLALGQVLGDGDAVGVVDVLGEKDGELVDDELAETSLGLAEGEEEVESDEDADGDADGDRDKLSVLEREGVVVAHAEPEAHTDDDGDADDKTVREAETMALRDDVRDIELLGVTLGQADGEGVCDSVWDDDGEFVVDSNVVKEMLGEGLQDAREVFDAVDEDDKLRDTMLE